MATEEKRGDGRTVTLKGLRLSFAESLMEAKPTVEGGRLKHTANLINEKEGKYSKFFAENQKKIMGAIEVACEMEFKRKDAWKEIQEEDPKRLCYRKGERFKNKETSEIYSGYAGNMVIAGAGPRAGRNRPGKMLDRAKRDIQISDIPEILYNGTYCDAIVSLYGTKEGGWGVFCSIELLRSYQEGEKMGGGPQISQSDIDDLDDMDDDYSGSSSSGGSTGDDFDVG